MLSSRWPFFVDGGPWVGKSQRVPGAAMILPAMILSTKILSPRILSARELSTGDPVGAG